MTRGHSAHPNERKTGIAARYMATRTYAKTALTLPAALPRFVRPRTAVTGGRDPRVTLPVAAGRPRTDDRWRCCIHPRGA